jgi:hypothetical protein
MLAQADFCEISHRVFLTVRQFACRYLDLPESLRSENDKRH